MEPDRFPGLRRQTRESKETKAAGVYRTEYWGRENCTEREFWRYAESLSSFLLSIYQHTPMRKEVIHGWGKNNSKKLEFTVPNPNIGLGIVFDATN